MTDEYPSLLYRYSECPNCRFVSSMPGLSNTSTPCPNCHQPGTRILFPELTPGALFDAAYQFRDAAAREIEGRVRSVTVTVGNEIGKDYDSAILLNVAQQASTLYSNASTADELDESWRRTLQMAGQELELDEEATIRVLAMILQTTRAAKEHTAMVVLTCAFLESMLIHILNYVAVTHGMTYSEADTAVDKIRLFIDSNKPSSPRTYDGFFYRRTRLHLEQAFERIGHRPFWDDWEQARKDRNDIMHGKLPSASADTRERISSILDRAIPVFAELQNQFGVTPPNP